MTEFCVQIREIQSTDVFIEADSPEAARLKVREGEGDYGDSTYLETLDPETWTVLLKK